MQVPGRAVHALGPWCWVQARPGPQCMRAPGTTEHPGAPGAPHLRRPRPAGPTPPPGARWPPAQRSPGGCSALIGRRGFGFPGMRVGARRAAPLRLGSRPRARSLGASPSVPCVPVLSPRDQDDHPTPGPAVQAEDGVSAEGERGAISRAREERGDHLGEVPAGTWAGLGAGLVGWGASLVVLVIAVSQLPRPLMVHIGLRGPDCPEGVYTPHLSEKLPVTPVTPGGNLPRNAPGIAPSFPGSGPQPLRPLRRIRLPTGH